MTIRDCEGKPISTKNLGMWDNMDPRSAVDVAIHELNVDPAVTISYDQTASFRITDRDGQPITLNGAMADIVGSDIDEFPSWMIERVSGRLSLLVATDFKSGPGALHG